MRPILPLLLAPLLATRLGAADPRLAPPRDLDGYFPFTPSAPAEAWAARAERLRLETRVALGLWPEPPRTPLHARIHGKVDRGEYTVERVVFESLPGFYVTGSLYRPAPGVGHTGADGRRAAVLNPHGHWRDGRFMRTPPAELQRELESGGEWFARGGASPLQAACVGLVRMGCVVFHPDMIGYADSVQLSETLAHRFATARPEMESDEGWGLFSARAEGHLQSVLGLQTWNGVRSLDFLCGLPDVDPARIGVTGASGGGTQTFLLGAVDPRPAAFFPAVMVSTAMQGGCTCENACLLRLREGNVALAALCAPRPLGLTSANDWTREMPVKGFPQLREQYRVLGAADRVELHAFPRHGHNYNAPSRAALRAFLNRHLGLARTEAEQAERDYTPLSREEMTVWHGTVSPPAGDEAGPAFERRLLRNWTGATTGVLSTNPAARALGWGVILGRPQEDAGDEFEYAGPLEKTDRRDWMQLRAVIRHRGSGEEVAATFLHPARWSGRTVIWLDGRDAPAEEAERLARNGVAVVLSRLFAPEAAANPVVANPREAAAFTLGYNPTLFARRVHDVLALVRFCRSRADYPVKRMDLVGLDGFGPHAAAARFLAGAAVDSTRHDAGVFRWASLDDWRDARFLPGALRYGDLPALVALPGTPIREVPDAAAAADALLGE